MKTTSKENAIRLAVIGVSIVFIASFALPAHPGLASAQQQNKTLTQPKVHRVWQQTIQR